MDGKALTGRTLYDKVWDSHEVKIYADGSSLLYIDRHLVQEPVAEVHPVQQLGLRAPTEHGDAVPRVPARPARAPMDVRVGVRGRAAPLPGRACPFQVGDGGARRGGGG